MKKVLMAATAIATAGAIWGTAGDAKAQTNWTLSLGGFYNGLVIVRDAENEEYVVPRAKAGGGTYSKTDIRDYDFNQRGRYRFEARNKLDNGITFGFQNQYEMQASFSNNRSFIFVSGGFGRVNFGTMYSGSYLTHVSAPSAGWVIDDTGHSQGFYSTVGNPNPYGGRASPATPTYMSNRNMKITYLSPRFGGLQIAGSFTPDTTGNSGPGNNNRYITDENSVDNTVSLTAFKNVVSLGANYSNTFGDFGVDASLGWETAEVTDGFKDTVANADSRNNHYSAGLNLSFGGLTAGAAYGLKEVNRGDDLLVSELVVGLTYATGQWVFGPNFSWSEGFGGDQNGGGQRIYIGEFGARYKLVPGVDLVASLEYAQFDKAGSGAIYSCQSGGGACEQKDGNSVAGLFGVQLNF